MQRTMIFTDGACSGNPGPGGWACVILGPDGRVKEMGGGEPRTTNNRMELRAVIEALRATASLHTPIAVYTDSTYVLGAVESWLKRWKGNGFKKADGSPVLNQDLWGELDLMIAARAGALSWHFVRGHTGIPGNERTDAIAVAFSLGKAVALYDGHESGYGRDLRRVAAAAAARP